LRGIEIIKNARKGGTFPFWVSWQSEKQGIVELYGGGEGSNEIKEFPKNIHHLTGLCFGDTKNKSYICCDNCCVNQHSFGKYSILLKINNDLIIDVLIFITVSL